MTGEEFIEHFGVKGMHWGVRREQAAGSTQVDIRQKTPGSRPKIVTSKGGGQAPSSDAITARTHRQTAKKSGSQALTNKQLQDLVTRLNLEKQYSQLTPGDAGAIAKGGVYVKKLVSLGRTTNDVVQFINSPAGKILKNRLQSG